MGISQALKPYCNNNIQKGLALSAGLDLGLSIAGRPIASGVKGVGKFLADPKRLGLTLVVGGEASTLLSGGGAANTAADPYTIKVAKVIKNLLARGYSQKQISLSLQSANTRLALQRLRNGSNASQIANADDLAKVRRSLGLDPNPTVAAGRTDIPGLENNLIPGLSPSQRTLAGMPNLNISNPNRSFKSPGTIPSARNHAEEDLLNRIDEHIKQAKLTESQLSGKSVGIHVSQRVCNTCRQGFGNDKPAGVLLQFSKKYQGITVRISNSQTKEILVIRGGRRIK